MSILLHFSDFHLFSDKTGMLKGILPSESFEAVLADAVKKYPEVSCIVLGGDIAQDDQAETYRYVAEMMAVWDAPVVVSPGNHDNYTALMENLVSVLEQRNQPQVSIQLGSWKVITINTCCEGVVSGLLSELELIRLRLMLEQDPQQKNTLIAMHHHPIPVGSLWMDELGLKNSRKLWDIISDHPQVKLLLCGHIHQSFDATYMGVRVLGSPSTSVQFVPGDDSFSLDGISPGYRWLELKDDGSIRTGVHRVDGFIPPDLNNTIPY